MIEYLKVARVDHWLKNIFIVFGHAVAIVLVMNMEITGGIVLKAFLSLLPACLIASANYIMNEILDAPFDALHPRKKMRPIPAGLSALRFSGSFSPAVSCRLRTGLLVVQQPGLLDRSCAPSHQRTRLQYPACPPERSRLPRRDRRVLQQSDPPVARLVCARRYADDASTFHHARVVVLRWTAHDRETLQRIPLHR